MANTAIDICAKACVLVGQKPIQSFTGGQKQATCKMLYDMTIENLIASYVWGFAGAKVQLARLVASPGGEWKYAYKLPPDRIGQPNAYYPSNAVGEFPFLSWELQGDAVLCNEEAVFCDYKFAPTVARWPAYFENLAVHAMAAVLAVPLTTDRGLAEFYHQMTFGTPQESGMGGLWLQATNADAQGQTNIALHPDSFVLVNVRGS